MIRLFFMAFLTVIACQVDGNEIDQSDLSYKNGVFISESTGEPLTGVVAERYSNGQMKSERHFQDGIEHGLNRSWFENGPL